MLRVASEHCLRWGPVVAGVDPHRPEQGEGGVFAQHSGRGALRPVVLVVHQTAPSRVIPGAGPESDRGWNSCSELLEPAEVRTLRCGLPHGHPGTTLNTLPPCTMMYSSPAASSPKLVIMPPGRRVCQSVSSVAAPA